MHREAHESTSKRLERILLLGHEDRFAGQGFNSVSQTFIPMPLAKTKSRMLKQWWTKNGQNSNNCQHGK